MAPPNFWTFRYSREPYRNSKVEMNFQEGQFMYAKRKLVTTVFLRKSLVLIEPFVSFVWFCHSRPWSLALINSVTSRTFKSSLYVFESKIKNFRNSANWTNYVAYLLGVWNLDASSSNTVVSTQCPRAKWFF